MAVQSQLVEQATSLHAHDSTGPITKQLTVALTKSNIVGQYSAGAPIADTLGPFTELSPTRLPQVTVGASHVETVYTLTGTNIVNGNERAEELTVAAGAGTVAFTKPFATITSFSSNINPGDTVNLEWGDTWVHPAARSCHVGTSGDVACRLIDDDADVTVPSVGAGEFPRRIKIIRITNTTASGLVLGW